MEIEQRKEQRLAARDISTGELYHPGSSQYFTVERVQNVSPRGMGLKVNGFLRQGEQIRLGFKRGRVHVQMYGYVVWCAPDKTVGSDEQSSSFLMGVTL